MRQDWSYHGLHSLSVQWEGVGCAEAGKWELAMWLPCLSENEATVESERSPRRASMVCRHLVLTICSAVIGHPSGLSSDWRICFAPSSDALGRPLLGVNEGSHNREWRGRDEYLEEELMSLDSSL